MSKSAWDAFSLQIASKKYILSIGDLNENLENQNQAPLTYKMKEFLFEAFKAKRNAEDNPDDINERLINVKELLSSKLSQKNKKIDDLIAIQREQDSMRDDIML